MTMKLKIIFAVLLAALTIGAVLVISRTANADVLTPGTAFVGQSADTPDSSRLGGARAGIGRPGIGARPGIGRPGINRPGIGVRPPIVRPPLVRPGFPVFNEVNVVNEEEEFNVVLCDEELLFFFPECFND